MTVEAEWFLGLKTKQSSVNQRIFYFLLGHIQTLRFFVSETCIVIML